MYIFLDSTCLWYHVIFIFLWLHSIGQSQAHLWCCKWYYFVISRCWFKFHCIYLPHLYQFLCQWTFRLLPCPTVNSATVNIGVHVSFRIMVFSIYMPRSWIAGSYDSSTFIILRISILLSIVSIYIPTNSIGGFLSIYTLSSICL